MALTVNPSETCCLLFLTRPRGSCCRRHLAPTGFEELKPTFSSIIRPLAFPNMKQNRGWKKTNKQTNINALRPVSQKTQQVYLRSPPDLRHPSRASPALAWPPHPPPGLIASQPTFRTSAHPLPPRRSRSSVRSPSPPVPARGTPHPARPPPLTGGGPPRGPLEQGRALVAAGAAARPRPRACR